MTDIIRFTEPIYLVEFPGDPVTMGVAGYPHALSNGYIIDLYGTDTVKLPGTRVTEELVDSYILTIYRYEGLLGRPEFICTTPSFRFVVMKNHKGDWVGIQEGYYCYFSTRYPSCLFTCGQDPHGIVGVKSSIGEIVGMIMPMSLPHRFDEEIAEYIVNHPGK